MDKLFELHGKPKVLRSDNGREFIAATLLDWLAERRVKPAFIEKGNPQQNSYVERFNGTMRDELLNGEESNSVLEVRVVITGWMEEYNQRLPSLPLDQSNPGAAARASRIIDVPEWLQRNAEIAIEYLERGPQAVFERIRLHDHNNVLFSCRLAWRVGSKGAHAALGQCADEAPDDDFRQTCRRFKDALEKEWSLHDPPYWDVKLPY